MSFLYPQFLYGLLALSIPIIVHLFNFRKTKRVYYSSTQFLKNIKEASTSRLKIKHWLILSSRLLFITFLVFAFAQPFIPAQQQRSSDPDVYIYLDNSASMTNEVGTDFRALDAGLSFINQLPGLFAAGTRYKLLTNDFSSFSNFFQSGNELSDLTTEISVSGNNRTFEEVWARMQSSIETGRKQNDIFWISDFQLSTIGTIEEVEIDSNYNFNLFPLDFESYSNLYIDSVYLNNPFFLGQDKVSLTAVLKNMGLEDKFDVPIKVFLNNIQNSNATIDVPAGSSAEVEFDLGFDLDELSIGRVSIEDYPITFDNDFYFTIDKGNKIDVMEIRSSISNTSVKSVYGNIDLYDFKSFSYTNIDYSQIELADLIVLNELNEIAPSLSIFLNEFLSEGGTLVVIPSSSPDLASYQSIIFGRTLSNIDSTLREELAGPDMANPFYERVFEEVSTVLAMPEATRVIQWGTDRTALLRFKNGQPFLSRIARNGIVYLFSGPLNDISTGFHNHALFVPVMYKMAIYSRQDFSRLYYSINNPVIEIRIDSIDQNSVVKMDREGEEFIPGQRLISGNMTLELPYEVLEPGFYNILLDSKKISTIAFNLDNKESDLSQIKLETLESTFGGQDNVSIFQATNEKEFADVVRKEYEGTPLWKFAIILALFFLLTEVLLIRFL